MLLKSWSASKLAAVSVEDGVLAEAQALSSRLSTGVESVGSAVTALKTVEAAGVGSNETVVAEATASDATIGMSGSGMATRASMASQSKSWATEPLMAEAAKTAARAE